MNNYYEQISRYRGTLILSQLLSERNVPYISPSRAKWSQGVGTSVHVVCQESTVPSSKMSKSIFLGGTTPPHPLLAKGGANSSVNPLSLPGI